jgi:hypothetical protein
MQASTAPVRPAAANETASGVCRAAHEALAGTPGA